ncbi:hypothetical protein BKA80DRAFT_129147 [Phyllosticta citrichinensis]
MVELDDLTMICCRSVSRNNFVGFRSTFKCQRHLDRRGKNALSTCTGKRYHWRWFIHKGTRSEHENEADDEPSPRIKEHALLAPTTWLWTCQWMENVNHGRELCQRLRRRRMWRRCPSLRGSVNKRRREGAREISVFMTSKGGQKVARVSGTRPTCP